MQHFPQFPLEGITNLPISQFQRQTRQTEQLNELSKATVDYKLMSQLCAHSIKMQSPI